MPVFLFITAALQLTDNQVLALVAPRLNAAFWPGSAIDASWLLTAYPIGAAIEVGSYRPVPRRIARPSSRPVGVLAGHAYPPSWRAAAVPAACKRR